MQVSRQFLVFLHFLCFFVFFVNSFRLRTNSCREKRVNRYGDEVCLDNSPRSGRLSCPFMPRIELDCNDQYYFKKAIPHKKCRSDSDCGGKNKCCLDICAKTGYLCVPGDFMSYFVPFK